MLDKNLQLVSNLLLTIEKVQGLKVKTQSSRTENIINPKKKDVIRVCITYGLISIKRLK